MDHNGNSSGKKIAFGENLSDNSIFREALTDSGGSSWQEYMTINQSGNVGIGTTNPHTALHVQGNIYVANGGGLGTPDPGTYGSNGVRIVLWPGSQFEYAYAIGMNGGTMWFGAPEGARFSFFGGGFERVRIQGSGNVGIGVTNPVVRLQVSPSGSFSTPSNFSTDGSYISDVTHKDNTQYQTYFAGHSTGSSSPYYSPWVGDYNPDDYESANAVSAYFEAGIMVGGRVFLESDKRIKHDIRVINDTFALRTIREIECYTYFYNDVIRRTPEITFGFLAQEVKEKLPMAVKMKEDFLPAAMTFAEDISWEEIVDHDKNKFKLTIPNLHKDASNNIVEHEPGTKFKFYLTDVSNNINYQDFCVSTLLEDGKSFILEKKANTYLFMVIL